MKILIIHSFGLGDMVMFTPALQKLIIEFPNINVDFLIFQKYTKYVIRKCKNVKAIYYCPLKYTEALKIALSLRKNNYDVSIVTSGQNPLKASLLSYIIGARKRIGEFLKYPMPWYTDNVRFYEKTHRVFDNIRLIKRLFNKDIKNIPKTKYWGIKKKIKNDKRKNKVLVGIHPGCNSKNKIKRWKEENFVNLIQLLKKNFNLDCIIFSGPGELKESKYIANNTDSQLFFSYSVDKIANQISNCDIFISIDSGYAHLASCFDLEIFTIFGPTKDYKTAPFSSKGFVIKKKLYCQPCYRTKKFKRCKSINCLNSLHFYEVYKFITEKSKLLIS